jgi:hypothetical protein
MRRPYRKHSVLINNHYTSVKNWMRNNPVHFKEYKSVPTSEQIGVVLKTLGFERIDSETEVIYQ